MNTASIITYTDTRGHTVNLTAQQVTALKAAKVWPKSHIGQEYAQVSHGLHDGHQTYTDAELAAEVGLARLP